MMTLFHKEKVYSSSRQDLLNFQKLTNKQHNGVKFFHHSRYLITDYLQGKFEPEINKMIEQFLTEYVRQRLWNYVFEYKEICRREPCQHENKRPWLRCVWCRQVLCSFELLAIWKRQSLNTDGNTAKFAWLWWYLAVTES